MTIFWRTVPASPQRIFRVCLPEITAQDLLRLTGSVIHIDRLWCQTGVGCLPHLRDKVGPGFRPAFPDFPDEGLRLSLLQFFECADRRSEGQFAQIGLRGLLVRKAEDKFSLGIPVPESGVTYGGLTRMDHLAACVAVKGFL